MKLTQSYISLHNVRFHAFHGVLPQERTVGNDYVFSLRAGYDVSRAIETDDVAHTLNYAALYEVVRQEMAIPSNLIEHVVGRIGERLLAEFPAITTLHLTLCKQNPPMGAQLQGAGVEVFLENEQ